jgi:hypothetical protein
MRLDDLQRESVGEFVRYSAPLPDESGAVGHELIILGPETRVRESFAESDFEVTIRPGERWSVEDLQREAPEEWLSQVADHIPASEVLRSAFDDPRPWLKKSPLDPTAEDSIFVIVMNTRPGGTYFRMFFRNIFIAPKATHFSAFTPITTAVHFVRAITVPETVVDVDLYLGFNGASGAFPVSSTLPAPLPDQVQFYSFPTTFMPMFKAFNFSAVSGRYTFLAEAVSVP